MSTYIQRLKNTDGDIIYPQTRTDAVYDDDNNRLDNLLQNCRIPIGTIVSYGGSTAPSGWLECNGAAVSRTVYDQLYDVIGTTYGSGNGSTTFNLPNFQGRLAQGAGDLGYETYTLGEEVDAGVPNITGVGHYADNNNAFSGALYNAGSANYIGDGSSSGTLIGLDASLSTTTGASDVYGNSTTVQPNTVVIKYIIKK